MSRDPYEMLANLPKFTLLSDDMKDGEQLGIAQLGARLGGEEITPPCVEWLP